MANYGPPPGAYGQGQGYGNFGSVPNYMGAPPGMGGAPGMSPPPGMNNLQSPAPGRPNGVPSQFQAPSGLPNINFNAPIIRMGMAQGKPSTPSGYGDGARGDAPAGNRGRMGLGADSGRQSRAEALHPPTKEEVARTIYIGGLVSGVPDDMVLEEILNVGRGLRKWSRVVDAEGKPCDFGFAEYDDAASLEIATKLFEDIELPLREKGILVKDENDQVKKAKIAVMIDPESENYIKQWAKPDENDFSFKIDTTRDDLATLLSGLSNASTNGHATDAEGDAAMGDGQGDGAEMITFPVAGAEDELSDVPPEMREQVAAEIKAFRERSIRRDMERLKKEEEQGRDAAPRRSRLDSPPPSAPTGPGGANGVPVGPRDRTVPGAPAGPKGYRGAQMPSDYVDGVSFVNGAAEEDEDDEASDEELERRRKEKRDAELEKRYLEQERRWLAKERAHFSAVDRQDREEAQAAASKASKRKELADYLKEFDDEVEKRTPTALFYKDHRAWKHERRNVRVDERRRDDHDRKEERREKDAEQRRIDAARGMADDFLAQQEVEIAARTARERPAEKQAFSLNLGGFGGLGAAKREDVEDRKPRIRDLQGVEALLGDDQDAADIGIERKPLRPAEFKPLAAGEKMTDEERQQATRQLAASLPDSADGLFNWPVKWEHMPDSAITARIRPYVQKKVMDALGVQEDLLVDVIETIIRRHGTPQELVKELEMLDEEAEDLAKKVWRMVIFYSECESLGLEA